MRKSLMILIMIIIIMLSFSSCAETPDTSTEENVQDAHLQSGEADIQKDTNTTENNIQDDKVELVMFDQQLSEHLASLMRERMPDVTFSYLPREGSDSSYESEEIVQRLLSGDDSFDIYLISSKSDFALTLLNEELFVDVSTYPEMNDVFDDLYPSFVEASTYNGKVIGLPSQFNSYGHLMYPRPYMDKIGWSLEQLKTMDNLLLFDKEWQQSNQDMGSIALHRNMVLDQIVFRYIYNHYEYTQFHIDLDNHAFYDVLTGAKELYDSDLVHDDYLYLGNFDYVLSGTYRPISHYADYLMIPQVKEQNDKNVMWTFWVVINPNSENIDTAVEMLSILAEVYKSEDVYMSYNDETEYSERIGEVFQEHQLYFAFPDELKVREIFTAYLNGEIQMEDAIAEAQVIIDSPSQE